MRDIFKDEDKEEGDSVTDLILAVVQLKKDINRLVNVMGHLYNTLYTSTCFHLFLLMQQEETDRETAI